MLVNYYKLEVAWQRGCCSCWQKATATLSEDIGKELIRLASVIEGSKYVPEENKVSFSRDNIPITIFPNRIEIAYIKNESEAHVILDWVKDMINTKYSEMESRKSTMSILNHQAQEAKVEHKL